MNAFMMDFAFLIATALTNATPMLFAGLGGVVSENSGVFNIGFEGIMTIGAFMGALTAFQTGNPWIGLGTAAIAGLLLSLLLAVGSITFMGDQTVLGTAINFIGPGLALLLSQRIFGGAQSPTLSPDMKIPKIASGAFAGNSFLGALLNIDASVILAFVAVIIIWFVLYKTRTGLRLRACGEHPFAAASLGVNVKRMRYICVLISGALGGIGGQ